MTLRLRLTLALECSVCGQLMLVDDVEQTKMLVVLVGAAPFAVCPCCQQRAPHPKDPGYRARARAWADETAGRATP